MKTFHWSCLFIFVVLGFAHGEPLLNDYTNSMGGEFYTAGFIPDATGISVGEPVFLTFVISNRAEQPLQFTHVRNEIFHVTATNMDRTPVNSRYFGLDGNGFSKQEAIPPGKSYTARIFLNERCVFDQPGDYTVTCVANLTYFTGPGTSTSHDRSHSLGPPVITTFQLTVLPNDPKRVTDIISRWTQLVETNGALNEAALALAEIKDPQTIPALARLVVKDSGNDIAINALTRYTNDAATDALAVALNGPDYTASIAGTALQNSHQADRIVQALLPGLTNPDANVRIQNARAVSWTHSELAFTPLVSLLEDKSNSVRYVAVESVGRLGDARSFAVLTNCLGNSDFVFRIAAVNGLRALGTPLQADWVKPMIVSGGENVRTFYDSIDLLRMYGGDQAAPGLASCLRFDDPLSRMVTICD